MKRSTFLKQSGIALMGLGTLTNCASGTNVSPDNDEEEDYYNLLFRTIEYNIFNGAIGYKGFNDTKPFPRDKKYDLVREARKLNQIPRRITMQLELYKPDIVSFCESAKEDTIKEMADWIDMDYAYFPSSNYKGSYPGTILTHFKIISSENRPFVGNTDNKDLFTRHWGKAIIELPKGKRVSVHSAHTWPFTSGGGKGIRLAEIDALLKSINYDLSNNVSSVILQGDMNLRPDTEGHKKLIKGGMVDAYTKVVKGKQYTATSLKPNSRIDYIFVKGDLADQLAKYRSLYEGAFRINKDDPKSFALSDHIPSLVDFKV
jgi:endonuclease/exonuclease/phosphatase family metal-dependent hydrolase